MTIFITDCITIYLGTAVDSLVVDKNMLLVCQDYLKNTDVLPQIQIKIILMYNMVKF